jgi:hypothetical protein
MTKFKSLEDKIQTLGNPTEFLRNAPVGATVDIDAYQ